MNYKMVMVIDVRSDISMSVGKTAAQVAYCRIGIEKL